MGAGDATAVPGWAHKRGGWSRCRRRVGLGGGMFVQGLGKERVNLGGCVGLVLTGWGALKAVCPRVLGRQDACWDLARAGFTPMGWLHVPALSSEGCPGEKGLCFSRGVVTQVLLCGKGRGSPGCLGTVVPGLVGFFPSRPCCPRCLQDLGISGDTVPPSSGAWRSEEQLGFCCCEVLRSLLSQKPACLPLPSAPKSPLALKEPFFSRREGGEGGSPGTPHPPEDGVQAVHLYLFIFGR